MGMKKNMLVFILLFGLYSCGPDKVIESTYDNGNPKVVKYYETIDGKKQVVKEEVYYENSNKKMEGEYINEKRNGKWSAWYEDGQLWSEGDYKEGKREGIGMVYHPNGKKYIESMYTQDEKTGKWRFYDSSGALLKEVDFDKLNAADSVISK